jgi:hypothetical protein
MKKTATSENLVPTTTSSIRIWAPISLTIMLMLSLFGFAQAQSIPVGSTWRVLDQTDISFDAQEIKLQREIAGKPLPQTKGRFAFSEMVFHANEVAMVYTAGRVGDSTAMSSQSYWPQMATYLQLGPNRPILRIGTDGCPEYAFEIQGDMLYFHRFSPESNRLTFNAQSTDFAEGNYAEAIVEDVANHFDCKQFDELLVTIKTKATEFSRAEAAQIPQLQEDRASLLKAMLYSKCHIQPDQLQVLSQVTYTDEPTGTFEFHKALPWMENDSLKFDIVPTMSASSAANGGAYHARMALTDKQKAQLNNWSQDDWRKYLHSPTSDFATNILLYAITLQDIPAWYKKGAQEWKQFGKEADLAKWEKYVAQQVPFVN